MITEHEIAKLINQLADVKGWKPSYASRKVTGSGDTLDRLQIGIGLTLRRANTIMMEISKNWPKDLEWPMDIPRPSVPKDIKNV